MVNLVDQPVSVKQKTDKALQPEQQLRRCQVPSRFTYQQAQSFTVCSHSYIKRHQPNDSVIAMFLNFHLEVIYAPWLLAMSTLLQDSWYHFPARIWTVKCQEKNLQMPASPLPSSLLTTQFSPISHESGGISTLFLKAVLSFS